MPSQVGGDIARLADQPEHGIGRFALAPVQVGGEVVQHDHPLAGRGLVSPCPTSTPTP